MRYYLEDRLHGARVGTGREECKTRSKSFAVRLAQDLKADDLLYEAEEYRQVSETLSRENGQNLPGD